MSKLKFLAQDNESEIFFAMSTRGADGDQTKVRKLEK